MANPARNKGLRPNRRQCAAAGMVLIVFAVGVPETVEPKTVLLQSCRLARGLGDHLLRTSLAVLSPVL
jgi:hypothetical protein